MQIFSIKCSKHKGFFPLTFLLIVSSFKPPGPRRSQQGQKKVPIRIINSMSLNDDVQLNKAEKAWKPSTKKSSRGRPGEEVDEDDAEQAKTQELFKRLRSILNKLTPQKFQELMKQVTDLKIDTEERLKGVIDLIFEKAISEPNFSVAYANMCRCLMTVSHLLLFTVSALMMTLALCHVSGPLSACDGIEELKEQYFI